MGPRTPGFDQGDDAVIFPDVRLVNPKVSNVKSCLVFKSGPAGFPDYRVRQSRDCAAKN